jgi:FlaG/FlaF family flagellin (archaellin)
MVAITVILAAVIGAFVLEIGDRQETAPNASFSSEQQLRFYDDGSDSSNLTTVGVTHAGGNTLDIDNVDIKVGGNGSQWGVETTESGNPDPAVPQPNQLEALGTNEEVAFTSGQTWSIVGGNNNTAPSDQNLDATTAYHFDYAPAYEGVYLEDGSNDDNDGAAFGSNDGGLDVLENGDNVNVVWTASSGGKTQVLFEYIIQ